MDPQEPGTQILRDARPATQRVRVYRLRVVGPDRSEQIHEVKQALLRVGSHQGNDLVLPDDAVSRIHFEITEDDEGFRLKDLGSTNGTFVDGTRVFDVYLRPVARITAGLTQLQFEALKAEAELPLSTSERFGPMVGRSPVMRELFATLERVAPTDATVLIQGESGTGKELLAEAIHGASVRRGGPLVVFDCSAIAPSLLESELFGHEKGAFTGAMNARLGCLESADGGTLFLDEIGELPLDLQPKLLRAVEKREIRRVGANKTRRVDVRIIAATNRDLAGEVNRGSFRDDLYYRLAVVRLRLPPLRERQDDIPLLVEHHVRQFLRHDQARAESILRSITPETWRRFQQLPWRGNVRELRNLVERRLALGATESPEFEPSGSVPIDTASPTAPAASSAMSMTDPSGFVVSIDLDRPLLEQKGDIVARFEKSYLEGVLAKQGGNISRAAAVAGIDRMYFKRLLKKFQS